MQQGFYAQDLMTESDLLLFRALMALRLHIAMAYSYQEESLNEIARLKNLSSVIEDNVKDCVSFPHS